MLATVVVGVVTCGAGFAFGTLLANSIGSALGSGIGVYSAATAGGDLGDGFLFGAIAGGAAGPAGYAGGAGSVGDIFAQAGIGFLVGAVVGGLIGWATSDPAGIGQKAQDAFSTGAVDVPAAPGYSVDTQYCTTTSGWQQLGQAASQQVTSLLQSVATPVSFNVLTTTLTGVASFGHAAIYHDRDKIRAWLVEAFGGEEEEVIFEIPVGGDI